MDVEGFKYEAFDVTPRDVLQRFQPIVFEIHDLHNLVSHDFRERFVRTLTKMNSDFTLFHVQANNVAGQNTYTFAGQNTYTFLSGLPVLNLLKLSYVRTDLLEREQSRTLYPTPLGYPNVDPTTTRNSGSFRFFPTSVTGEAVFGRRSADHVGAELPMAAAPV
jgi:hypothetical protein